MTTVDKNWFNQKRYQKYVQGDVYQNSQKEASLDFLTQYYPKGLTDFERGYRLQNFQKTAIPPRRVYFTDTPMINEVKLAQESVDQLVTVSVPDDTDTEWLDEEKRLSTLYDNQLMALYPDNKRREQEIKKVLESNPPLGRKQRTRIEKRRISSDVSSDSINTQLSTLENTIRQGTISGTNDSQSLEMGIQKMIGMLKVLNDTQRQNLYAILQSISIPTDPKIYLGYNIVDYPKYQNDGAKIKLFLMRNLPTGLTLEKPLIDLSKNNYIAFDDKVEAKLRETVTLTNESGQPTIYMNYINLDTRRLIDYNTLRSIGEQPTPVNQPSPQSVVTTAEEKKVEQAFDDAKKDIVSKSYLKQIMGGLTSTLSKQNPIFVKKVALYILEVMLVDNVNYQRAKAKIKRRFGNGYENLKLIEYDEFINPSVSQNTIDVKIKQIKQQPKP